MTFPNKQFILVIFVATLIFAACSDDDGSSIGVDPEEIRTVRGMSAIVMKKRAVISGFALVRYSNGTLYMGNTKANFKEGKGVRTFPDSRFAYVGDFKADRKEGLVRLLKLLQERRCMKVILKETRSMGMVNGRGV